MKLIVQIPCYNEEETLPLVINSIPKKIKGVNKLETLIVDDGSTDRTVEIAKKLGVNYIVRHKKNKGLAQSFADGVNACLRYGADIVVNTDGDNQYPQKDIPKLIKPILDKKYDIVVADRQTDKIKHFSPIKKFFQRIGSKMVQIASGTRIPDAPSGFRAYSKEALMKLNIVTSFSYVTETIIQAGKKRIPITHIKVKTNPKTRESRLFKNIFEHIQKSTISILRIYAMYEPMRIFLITGITIFSIGSIPYVYFLGRSLWMGEKMSGHIQSLIFGGVIMILGLIIVVVGVVADLIAINRKLLEDQLYMMKRIEYSKRNPRVLKYLNKNFPQINNYSNGKNNSKVLFN